MCLYVWLHRSPHLIILQLVNLHFKVSTYQQVIVSASVSCNTSLCVVCLCIRVAAYVNHFAVLSMLSVPSSLSTNSESSSLSQCHFILYTPIIYFLCFTYVFAKFILQPCIIETVHSFIRYIYAHIYTSSLFSNLTFPPFNEHHRFYATNEFDFLANLPFNFGFGHDPTGLLRYRAPAAAMLLPLLLCHCHPYVMNNMLSVCWNPSAKISLLKSFG